MDINLLVVNVGNSRLSMGAFVAGELQYTASAPAGAEDQWAPRLAEAWGRIDGHANAAVAGASVNPPIVEPLEAAVRKTCDTRVQWIGDEIDLPIDVLTEHPTQTGVDRILNIAAAYEQLQKACVVVDAGSAITVDLCNDKGDFLGGTIAPGVTMQLDVLHEKTAKLPRVDFAAPKGPIGKSTAEAIRSGVFHGVRGMVKELVEAYATEQGSWPEIIATGGDAKLLFEGWELIHAISPDLTLYGIALAYANHHIKHGT